MKKLARVAVLGLGLALAGCGVNSDVNSKDDDKNIFHATTPKSLEGKDRVILDILNKNSQKAKESDSEQLMIGEALKTICLQENCSVEQMESHTKNHVFFSKFTYLGESKRSLFFQEYSISKYNVYAGKRNMDARERVNTALKLHKREMRLLPWDMSFYKHLEENARKDREKKESYEKARKEMHEK